MSVTVTELSAFERRLTIRFHRLRLDRAETRAARRLSRDIDINGFRRGKAPRRLVERIVGRQRIRGEAIEDLLGDRLPSALMDAELVPATNPSVDDAREVDGGLEVDVRVSLWPTLEFPPDYVGRRIEVSQEAYEVDEDLIEAEMNHNREQFAELETVERASMGGDYVAIDLHVSRNGQPVEPVSISDYMYEVGSEGFLDGLGEELAGRSAGDIVGFASALRFEAGGLEAGTPVDVRVLVKEVKERRLPELNDEWVYDFTEFDTVEELREAVISELESSRLSTLRREFSNKLIADLVGEMQVDIPPAVIDADAARQFDQFCRRLDEGGIDFEEYLEAVDQDREALFGRFREEAAQQIRTRVLLDSVAAGAELEVEEHELARAYEDMAEQFEGTGQQLAKRLAGSVQEMALVGDILRLKALDTLMRGAVAADRHGNVLDLRFDPPAGDDIVEAEIELGDQ
ncbi:MAG: trigger factor [bacterium]|nr:trigger factor [bacterium]